MKIRISETDEFCQQYYGLVKGAVFEVIQVNIRTGRWSYRIETIDSYPHNFQGQLKKIWVRDDECEQINEGKGLKELLKQ